MTMISDTSLSAIFSTVTGEKIHRLIEVYDALDSAEKAFCSAVSLKCTPSCGECCRHYVPVLTESEAEVAAWAVINEKREDEIIKRLEKGDKESGVCPLYNKDKAEHCSLYEGRSMVCRLFGSSVSLDKNGEPAFKDCKWKKKKLELKKKDMEENCDILPVMSIYGESLEGEGESIYTALPKAIDKIKLLLSYSSSFPS